MRGILFAALMAPAMPVWAQAQPPASNEPAPVRRSEIYVRRLSGGLSVSAGFPTGIREETFNQLFTTTPVLEIRSSVVNKSTYFGFGAVGQLALTNRWAVAVAPMLRTGVKFEATTVRLTGTDNPNTVQDDREGTNLEAKTSARWLDIPVMARFYGKSRRERGVRWFVEAGPRWRRAFAVRTVTTVRPPTGKGDPFNTFNPVDYKKMALGATAGWGMQFIDDFGIRFIPEVRYSRWFNANFGDITGRSQRQQIELIFTLSF